MDSSFPDKLFDCLAEDDHTTSYTGTSSYPDPSSTGLPSTTKTNINTPYNFNQQGLTIQGFKCPDCPNGTTSCVGCFRFERNFRTNMPFSPPQKTSPFNTITPIPPACYNCPNHPINGGSGNCNCTLGVPEITC